MKKNKVQKTLDKIPDWVLSALIIGSLLAIIFLCIRGLIIIRNVEKILDGL